MLVVTIGVASCSPSTLLLTGRLPHSRPETSQWLSGAHREGVGSSLIIGAVSTQTRRYGSNRGRDRRAADQGARRGRGAPPRRRGAARVDRIAGAAALPLQHAELDRGARARRSGRRRADDRPARVAAPLGARQHGDAAGPARSGAPRRPRLSRHRARPVRRSAAVRRPPGRRHGVGDRAAHGAADARREQREIRRLAAPRGGSIQRHSDRRRRPASASGSEDDGPGSTRRAGPRSRPRAARRAAGDAVRRSGVDAH